MLNGVMTAIGSVNPFMYPRIPPALIFSVVIMMKTTTAHAASVERSAVGLLNIPVKLIRFDTTLVAKSAATKGIRRSNLVPPVLFLTRLFAESTRSSAIA